MADYLAENGYSTASIGKIHFECTDCGPNAPRISMEDHRLWEEKGDNIDWYGPYWGYQYVELTCGHSTKPIAHYGNGITNTAVKTSGQSPDQLRALTHALSLQCQKDCMILFLLVNVVQSI